jgi:hypothetical protein
MQDPSVHGSSVIRHVGDDGAWSEMLHPGLHISLGPLWFVVLALVGLAIVAAVARPVDPRARFLGIVAGSTLVAYLATPNTAQAAETIAARTVFLLNLRYAMPGLAVALCIPAASRWVSRRISHAIAALMFAVVTVDQFPRRLQRVSWEWTIDTIDVVVASAIVVAITLMAGLAIAMRNARPRAAPPSRDARLRSKRRATAAVGAAVAVIAVALAGNALTDAYLRRWYARAEHGLPMSVIFPWAARQHDARIGLVGDVFQYPLFGRGLDNRVRYLDGPRAANALEPPRNCGEWRRALAHSHARYVAIVPTVFRVPSNDAVAARRWLASMPGVRVVLDDDGATLFRLDEGVTLEGCP